MFIVEINNDTQKYVRELLKTKNFGVRPSGFNGSSEQQFHGICAEVELQKLFKHELTNGSKGFDNGCDIKHKNLIIDVKTMNRSTDFIQPTWVNNLTKSQTVYGNNVYIFTSLNKMNMNLTVCGWISKSHMFKVAKLYKKGDIRYKGATKIEVKVDNYEIEMCDLTQVNSFRQMLDQMNNYSKFISDNNLK